MCCALRCSQRPKMLISLRPERFQVQRPKMLAAPRRMLRDVPEEMRPQRVLWVSARMLVILLSHELCVGLL